MSTEAYARFRSGESDVDRLFEIHPKLTGGVQGKSKQLTKPLLKAILVFVAGSFESYCEDMIVELAKRLAASAKDSTVLHKSMRQRLASKLHAEKDQLSVWRLSGEGWRSEYRSEVEALCSGPRGGLNTPNSRNLKELFRQTLNIADITTCWKWQNMDPSAAVTKLDRLIELRGAIAHGRDPGSLNVNYCRSLSDHVKNLAQEIDGHALSEVEKHI